MPILEDPKEYGERTTGLRRPGKGKAANLARERKIDAVCFKDDGLVPNHPRWPLIIHRGQVDTDECYDSAAVMGCVRFGGKRGRIFTLKAGDVAVLPAGTGHRLTSAVADFLVTGAYPSSGTYDECTTVEDRPLALKTILKVALARNDPVYYTGGPPSKLWKKAR